MGPITEAHDGKSSKSIESSTPLRPASKTPTTLRLLADQELQTGKIDDDDVVGDASSFISGSDLDMVGRRSMRAGLCEGKDSEKQATLDTGVDANVARKGEGIHRQQPLDATHTTADSSPSRLPDLSQVPSMANSLASLSLDSQAPMSSTHSSPRSLSRQSLRHEESAALETGSQAVTTDSEDEGRNGQGNTMQDSAPQLIMPSIRMPSRRPFTERGKSLGRLRILLAGAQSTGKTSLIKSIVQTCEDIVHIDPLVSSSSSVVQPLRNQPDSRRSSSKKTRQISEVYASTRPYPSWRSETESISLLGRRKSMGDTILERNLCFVDTPGLEAGSSSQAGAERTLGYICDQARKSFTTSTVGGDVVGLLSGSGGVQVDLVLYLLSEDIRQAELDLLRRISYFTNIIIVFSKSDDRSIEETELLKRSLTNRLEKSGVRQFRFPQDGYRQAPFAVCSISSDDDDNMDASLLMSSEYIQPLVPSDLSILLEQIFQSETVSCMRHLAARKLVEAQNTSLAPSGMATSGSGASKFGGVPGRAAWPPSSPLGRPSGQTLSPFVQASISDHTVYEERLAQLKLAKWAADLQRSLQNERQRYETLKREEQAAWLTQRLDELERADDANDGNDAAAVSSNRKRKSGVERRFNTMKDEDPLGIIHYYEHMKQNGWMAVRVAGSFGILGAIAVWVARNWSSGNWEINWWKGA